MGSFELLEPFFRTLSASAPAVSGRSERRNRRGPEKTDSVVAPVSKQEIVKTHCNASSSTVPESGMRWVYEPGQTDRSEENEISVRILVQWSMRGRDPLL